jgi:hypothetical protein
MRLELTIELPENLGEDQRCAATRAAQEAAVLTLFRSGAISSRVAAQTLGLSYTVFLDRIAELGIFAASGPLASARLEALRQQAP